MVNLIEFEFLQSGIGARDLSNLRIGGRMPVPEVVLALPPCRGLWGGGGGFDDPGLPAVFDGGFRTVTNSEILGTPDQENKLRLIRFSQTFCSILSVVVLPAALLAMTGYWLTANVARCGEPLMFFLAVGATMAVSFLGWCKLGCWLAWEVRRVSSC